MWINDNLSVDIPLASMEWVVWNNSTQKVRAVLLMPPATTPDKWKDFQWRLWAQWISSDIIVNRGTAERWDLSYSFPWMKDDLLKVLSQVRVSYPDDKLVLSASCLSTIVLALALPELYKKKLIDWMIVWIPVSPLETVAWVHENTLEWLQHMYKKLYNLEIDLWNASEFKSISPIEQLSILHEKDSSWKPFIYYNNYSKYLTVWDKNTFIDWVMNQKMEGIVLDWKSNNWNEIWHDLSDEDIPMVEKLTIAYMQGNIPAYTI